MANLLKLRLGVSDDPTAFQPSLNDCLEAMLQQADLLVTDMLDGMVAACAPSSPRRIPAFQEPSIKGVIESLSADAKAVATAWQRPLLRLDPGVLYDRFIGESERRLRDALPNAPARAGSSRGTGGFKTRAEGEFGVGVQAHFGSRAGPERGTPALVSTPSATTSGNASPEVSTSRSAPPGPPPRQ